MDFRILGPLEVVDNGHLVAVRGAKPRALLALLLVHANRVVSRDRLVDALWDEHPPTTATATLHTYVSQLRKDVAPNVVRTHGQAYVLEAAESAVDALRFEAALRAVPTEASPNVVAARLGEALAWWRGPALAEFRGASWARAEAARLEELRMRAIESRAAARLDCRDHAALAPELQALVEEHPLRERLWAQLMLALYRCDRQADALRAYGCLRGRLRDELGIEPSRELQRLEASILRQDVELEWNHSPPRTSAAPPREAVQPAPTRVPGRARDPQNPSTALVGRRAEIDAVCRLVRQRRLVTLTGAGGCGKTRLAVEAARHLVAEFPDGVRFADLSAVSDPDQVSEVVTRALGLAGDPTDTDPLDRLSTYLSGRTLLCVLDNCEHVLDACAELAGTIVGQAGVGRLLATSREGLGVLGEQLYVVPPLDRADAVSLFADRGGEARATFRVDDTNREVVAEICERLDGVALAIELAAARLAHLSPEQILDRLDDRFRLLTSASRRAARHQSLAATLAWSYDLLDPPEKETLRRLAAFPGDFSLESAEAVVSAGDAVGLLGSLVAKSLVQTFEDGERLRYRLLESVRAYARAKAVEAGDDKVGHSRQMRWVVDWLESIPFEQRWLGDVDLISAEYPNLLGALEWSARTNDYQSLARVAAGVDWTRSDAWKVGLRWCKTSADASAELPPDLQNQLYVILWGLCGMTIHEAKDWHARNGWARRAVDIHEDSPTPFRAVALAQLGAGIAAEAARQRLDASGRRDVVDDSLVDEAKRCASIGTEMTEDLSAPWQMYCQLMAGRAYTNLMAISLDNAETAEQHYLAGIGAAPVGSEYVGLHTMLCGDLAILRLFTGDMNGARLLAHEASALGTTSAPWAREYPLALALAVAFGSPIVARRALREYDQAAEVADWALAPETVAFYGGVAAAVREDWEAAGRLLGAGERSTLRSPTTGLLFYAFCDRLREAVGADRVRQLVNDGRAMALAEARTLALS